MAESLGSAQRVIIVGGGFAGLSIAARLGQAGVPVTLLEASALGYSASTRNQGWLYSGAVFATEQTELAKLCYTSLRETIDFCPDCLEPQHDGMLYLVSKPDTRVREWTKAWEAAEIPFEEYPREKLASRCPELKIDEVQRAFLLPDRAIRTDILLCQLAATAKNAGAEIRTETSVGELLRDREFVTGVKTAAGELIHSAMVILATGAAGSPFWSEISSAKAGCQSGYCRVALKTHLIAVKPHISPLPFCILDQGGFNHIPHAPTSVFGSNHWTVVADPLDQHVVDAEIDATWRQINRFFPGVSRDEREVNHWAGTTVQAMHYDQIEPGRVPRPTVIDHAQESPVLKNLISVFPGRATLWAYLAEQTRQLVLESLQTTPTSTAKPPWALSNDT